MELLKDREVWIADTGASNHSTPYKLGAVNERPSDVLAQGATGAPVAPTCEIDIPTTICDKFGNEKGRLMLTEVGHMADGRYNLFSVSRAMMDGWKLLGRRRGARAEEKWNGNTI